MVMKILITLLHIWYHSQCYSGLNNLIFQEHRVRTILQRKL